LVRGILADEQNDIFTSMLSVAEVVSVVERTGRRGRRAAEALESASVLVPLDFTLSVSAGLIHAKMRSQSIDFPYGDAAVVATAKTLRARIVTFDRHFEGLDDVLFLDET
jgi:predicted nucleic acid-binding protein